jgi:FixJ family two-component response regulator|tara:strand:- start:138 stop:785 length:648 start_codon:yes stop_codon:yes gene_type:complete
MKKEGIVYIVGDPGDWEYIGEFAVEVIHFSTASSLLLSLNTFDKPSVSCILADIFLFETTGPKLLTALKRLECHIPVIFFYEGHELAICIAVMRAGALNVLDKKTNKYEVFRNISEAFQIHNARIDYYREKRTYKMKLKKLSKREFQIYKILVAKEESLTSKEIGEKLHISWRTVHQHRVAINSKMEVKAFKQLVKMAAYYDFSDKNIFIKRELF